MMEPASSKTAPSNPFPFANARAALFTFLHFDMIDLETLSWSQTTLFEGLQQLAQRAGLQPTAVTSAPNNNRAENLNRWLTNAAAQLNIGLQEISWQYRDYETLLQVAAPAILQIDHNETKRYLLLLQRGRMQITILTPQTSVARLSVQELLETLRQQQAGPFATVVDTLLARTELSADRIPAARAALLAEQLNATQLTGCWLLQPPAHASFWQQFMHSRLSRHLITIFSMSVLQQILTLGAWYAIGRSTLQQYFEPITVAVWILLLLTIIPVEMTGLWAQSSLTLDTSKLFRSRLMRGILNLQPNEVRHLGSGQFLERVMQTESFQSLLLGGGLTALIAIVQWVSAIIVLSMGAGGWLHALLLLGWGILTAIIVATYIISYRHWSDTYRRLTNDLVERMVGHRTRLAQESREVWHVEEDTQLAQYQLATKRADRWQLVLNALINRGWLTIGLLGIALPFLAETPDVAQLAVSLGGIILASNALSAITAGVLSLAHVQKAWRDVGPLLNAAAKPQPVGTNFAIDDPPTQEGGFLVVARDISFQYRPNSKPVLGNVNLDIAYGDRLLLEGASGGGKSTFASILMGLRQPTSGLLLLHGLDQQTMGLADWQQRVVAAPQFHENHILTETLAFNLLMGRRWPATDEDLHEATQICYELGLGDLLQRMPSGMQQMIGEGGWQLSHGERSRLFIARTLLQRADLIVLDESFAALDPTNLQLAIQCVLRRAPTLLVIAHP